MSNPSVIISLSLGNAAMSERSDIAEVLDAIAARIVGGDDSGMTKDFNGNTVGTWAIVWPEGNDDPS